MADVPDHIVPEDVAAAILRLSVKTLRQARWDHGLQAQCLLPAAEKHGGRVYYAREALQVCLSERLAVPRLAKKYHKAEEAVPA